MKAEIPIAARAPQTVPAQRISTSPPPPIEAGHVPGLPSINVNLPKRASSLGIAALILGVLAFLLCWVPLVGVLTLPLSGLGLIFGIVGLLISVTRKGSGIGYPIAGGIVSTLALIIAIAQIAVIGSAANAVATAAQHANQQMSRTNQQVVTPARPIPVGSHNQKNQLSTLTLDKPQELAAPKAAEPQWASARQPVRQGDIQVTITKVRVGKVPLNDMFGQTTQSKDDLLAIEVDLLNLSKAKKIEYNSWRGGDFTMSRDFGTLVDNIGNSYKRINFSMSTEIVGQTKSASIYPGKTLHDVLVFEPPVGTEKYLDLELPASNFDGTGMLRLRIPADMIQK
jgi:hypothetical protein